MIRKLCAVAGCVFAFGVLVAPSAQAHALLVHAQPSDGAALASSPSQVTLAFSETPDAALSHVDVLDTSGTNHAGATKPGSAPRSLSAPVQELHEGVYTVSWRVISRTDGHLTAGAYAFGVGVSPTAVLSAKIAKQTAPAVSKAEVAGRTLFYLGLVILLGGVVAALFVLGAIPPSVRRLLVIGGLVGVAGCLVLALAQRAASGAGFSTFVQTSLGRALLERTAGMVVALGAVAVARRRVALVVAGLATIAAIVVHVSAGHADAGGLVIAKVPLQVVHVVAVCTWIGGLLAVVVAVRGADAATRARAVSRFSTAAGVALFVVAGTGVVRAYQEVGSWTGLLHTSYGQVVIAKAALLAVLGALGAVNRFRNVAHAGAAPARLYRTATAELGIAAAVLALAGLLASLAPAKTLQAQTPTGVHLQGADFSGDVTVTLDITPGRAGVNAFTAKVDASRVRGVSLRLRPSNGDIASTTITLRHDDGDWIARGSAIAAPGRWSAIVVVDRGLDSVEIPLAFHTACGDASVQTTGGLDLYTIDLGDSSVQAYLDPGRRGTNAVHFTFFDAKGGELPLQGTGAVRGFTGRRGIDVKLKKLSPGHVVGSAGLVQGRWVFDYTGQRKGGDAVNVCFEETIK